MYLLKVHVFHLYLLPSPARHIRVEVSFSHAINTLRAEWSEKLPAHWKCSNFDWKLIGGPNGPKNQGDWTARRRESTIGQNRYAPSAFSFRRSPEACGGLMKSFFRLCKKPQPFRRRTEVCHIRKYYNLPRADFCKVGWVSMSTTGSTGGYC